MEIKSLMARQAREFARRFRKESKNFTASCGITVADIADACALSLFTKKTSECWRLTPAGEKELSRAVVEELRKCYAPSRLTKLLAHHAITIEFLPEHGAPSRFRLTIEPALAEAA